uniref:Uncharacterized protein AlNc14C165G7862 n=1 Tax=Albugo laibachii Nc14 TaxID=890382 RepID=F0WN30_9STRA|nr:conserved hypothetical protein [Albugo laibachii Nc14]|eukprot:CCA22717.1 conserved hypothetical protein [Albugo laibachii Nc14]
MLGLYDPESLFTFSLTSNVTTMADFAGYLLLHDGARVADPLYFELESGFLRYFLQKNGQMVGQVALTKHRVTVKALQGLSSPNRFLLELRPVYSMHDCNRPENPRRTMLILSAACKKSQVQWTEALKLWRRRFWKQPVLVQNTVNEQAELRDIMSKFRLEARLTRCMKEQKSLDPVYVNPAAEDKSIEKQAVVAKKGTRISNSAQAALQFLSGTGRFTKPGTWTPTAIAA